MGPTDPSARHSAASNLAGAGVENASQNSSQFKIVRSVRGTDVHKVQLNQESSFEHLSVHQSQEDMGGGQDAENRSL